MNVPVEEFPEYVMFMTQEDDYNTNNLAREFLVTRKLYYLIFIAFLDLENTR